MTEQEQAVLALEKYIGYKKRPPSIWQFITDPYYLGGTFNPDGDPEGKNCLIFPVWRKVLKECIPNSVSMYPYIALTGSIGIGKTSIFQIMMLMSICKFLHIDSFPKFSRRANTKGYSWVFCTVKLESAEEFVSNIKEIMYNSPYFREQIANMGRQNWNRLIHIRPASKVTHLISNDCICILLSEINESVQADANGVSLGWKLMTEADARLMSRYRPIMGLMPQLLLDSSSKDENSLIDQFIQSAPFKDQLRVYSYPQWEVHSNDPWFQPRPSDGRTKFWVYIGSPEVEEHVIDKEELTAEDIQINADKDLYHVAPIELIERFKSNCNESIKIFMGKTTRAGASFFSVGSLVDSFSLPALTEDVITIDEALPTPLEANLQIQTALNTIQEINTLYIGIDLGTKRDLTGICISYISQWEEKEINGDIIMVPHFNAPVIFGLNRMAGQSTSISRIENFLYYLNTRFRIGMILTDGYGSLQMLQNLTYKRIPCDKLSVESEAEYSIFKNLCIQKQVALSSNSLLRAELLCLKRTDKGNLDHPATGNAEMKDGKYITAVSKDIADATCRSILGAYTYSRDTKTGFPIQNTTAIYKMLNTLYENDELETQKQSILSSFKF